MKGLDHSQLKLHVDEIRRQLSRRQNDRHFEGTGRVIYALDSDVIATITAPWTNQYRPYLHGILEEDGEAAESLAWILGEFFLSNDSKIPYVVVHPSENELEGMWNAVYLKAKDEDENVHEGLDKILDGQLRDASSDERLAFDVVKRALEAVHGVGGAIAELRRITRVIESGCIRRMDTISEIEGAIIFPAPSEEDMRRISHLEQDWLRELNHVRRIGAIDQRSGHPANNLIDAGVLARVEWINEHYISSNSKLRLCLITGDVHIEKVAQNRMVKDQSFAEAYIRTPISFLANTDFFDSAHLNGSISVDQVDPALAEFSFLDWLNVLVPANQDGLGKFGNTKSIRKNISSEFNETRTQWARYLRSAASSVRISSADLAKELDKYLTARHHIDIDTVKSDFQKLQDLFENVKQDASIRFGVSGALAGYWSLDYIKGRMSRGIPVVKFNSYPEAARHVRELRKSDSLERMQRQIDRKWIRSLQSKDKTGYTVFVVFSLAFALAGEWETALIISRAAFSIGERCRKQHPEQSIKGDEAAYLCAVFSRLCAKSYEDLENCETWLDLSDSLQKIDPIRTSLQSINNLKDYVDPRIAAERLAIRVSRRFFIKFGTAATAPVAAQLLVLQPIADECKKHIAAFDIAQGEVDDSIRDCVSEQLACNFLQLQILAMGESDSLAIDKPHALQFIKVLQKGFGVSDDSNVIAKEEDGFLGRSRLIYFVYLCSSMVFMRPEMDALLKTNTEFLKKQLEKNGDLLAITPYDHRKVAFFSSVALTQRT